MERQKVLFAVLVAALIVSVGYIVADLYQKAKTEEQFAAYQQGVQVGYQQAVVQLVQQVSTCQQVPVILGNQTINVIAVACLQQAAEG